MSMPFTGTSAVKVAVGQMTSSANKLENFKVCSRMAQEAVAAGATFLALPENFNFIGSHWAETVAAAEPLTGPSMKRFRQLAQDSGLWLSLGGFHEAVDAGHSTVGQGATRPRPREGSWGADSPSTDDVGYNEHDHESKYRSSSSTANKVYNCHVIISATGTIEATYRKIHLFDVDISGGPVMKESHHTLAGTELVVVRDTPIGNIGMSTCYDVRFPEMYSCLAEKGSQTMLVPSAFTVPTGQAHWEVLLRARAIETQSYVIASAQVGQHNSKRTSYGHSLIVDPWGRVLVDAGGEESPCIRTTEINLSDLAALRRGMPVADHRRAARPIFTQQRLEDAGSGTPTLL